MSRDPRHTVVCAWCKRVVQQGTSPTAFVSHTICEECEAKMESEEAMHRSGISHDTKEYDPVEVAEDTEHEDWEEEEKDDGDMNGAFGGIFGELKHPDKITAVAWNEAEEWFLFAPSWWIGNDWIVKHEPTRKQFVIAEKFEFAVDVIDYFENTFLPNADSILRGDKPPRFSKKSLITVTRKEGNRWVRTRKDGTVEILDADEARRYEERDRKARKSKSDFGGHWMDQLDRRRLIDWLADRWEIDCEREGAKGDHYTVRDRTTGTVLSKEMPYHKDVSVETYAAIKRAARRVGKELPGISQVKREY